MRAPGAELLGHDDLADILERILVEGVAISEVGDLKVDNFLVNLLDFVSMDLALHIESANLAGDAVKFLPKC